MTDYTQMHVFFAVTTAAVILITALVCAVLVAVFRFMRTLDRIAGEVEEEAGEIREDIHVLREDLKKKLRFVPWLHFFGKVGKRLPKRSASRKKTRS